MTPQKFNLANIGGTFSSLHDGVRTYIRTAFDMAERVQIVVNDTDFAQATRAYPVPELQWRLRELDSYLRESGWNARAEIVLCPKEVREFGAWLEPQLDLVLVSERLRIQATRFNELRVSCGLAQFSVHIMTRLRDEQGLVMSGTNQFFAQADALSL